MRIVAFFIATQREDNGCYPLHLRQKVSLNGKSCFFHRALVEAFFEALKCHVKSVFEASKLVSTKTPLLKHDYCRQGTRATLLNGRGTDPGFATLVWQEHAHTRVTDDTHVHAFPKTSS